MKYELIKPAVVLLGVVHRSSGTERKVFDTTDQPVAFVNAVEQAARAGFLRPVPDTDTDTDEQSKSKRGRKTLDNILDEH